MDLVQDYSSDEDEESAPITVASAATSEGHGNSQNKQESVEQNGHQGCSRSFSHQEGNYATHVYITGKAMPAAVYACQSFGYTCHLMHIWEARPSHQCVCSCIATGRVSCMLTNGLAVPAVAVPDELREPMHTLLSAIKQALPSLESVLASDAATTKVKIS
jgi:hypothetical protein